MNDSFCKQLFQFRFSTKLFCALTVFSLFFLVSCKSNDKELSDVIERAGTNGKELKKVLEHYRQTGDTLGYRSAVFLIKNMEGHNTITETQINSDISTIKSDFLVESIDYACQLSRNDIESNALQIADFFEYVLPYRLANEPLSEWRQQCTEYYGNSTISQKKINDIDNRALFHICKINENLISKGFKYTTKGSSALVQTWEELNRINKGDCWAIANSILFPLRAAGIPNTVDFITSWGNVNGGGHAWNVYLAKMKKEIPFPAFEKQIPKNYNPFIIYGSTNKIPAKVFRKTFSKEAISTKDNSNVNYILGIDHAIDVTDHYVDTKDVNLVLNNNKENDIVLLTVFQDGLWAPVLAAKKSKNAFLFKKMAQNVLFIPCIMDYSKGLAPVADPFVIKNGKVIKFSLDEKKKIDITIKYLKSIEMDITGVYGLKSTGELFEQQMKEVYSGKRRSRPEDGKHYQLYQWKGKWVHVGSQTKIPGKDLKFKDVASNGVYRVFESGNNNAERLFSYEEGNQFWW